LAAGVGLGVLLFVGAYEAGVGALFWVLVNEQFPDSIKGVASTLGNILFWLMNVTLTLLFPLISSAMGVGATFFLYGGICLLCAIYFTIWLKESKVSAKPSASIPSTA